MNEKFFTFANGSIRLSEVVAFSSLGAAGPQNLFSIEVWLRNHPKPLWYRFHETAAKERYEQFVHAVNAS